MAGEGSVPLHQLQSERSEQRIVSFASDAPLVTYLLKDRIKFTAARRTNIFSCKFLSQIYSNRTKEQKQTKTEGVHVLKSNNACGQTLNCQVLNFQNSFDFENPFSIPEHQF